MDNQIELKPCPFCGGEATFMRYSAGSIGAGCRKCAIMFFVLNGNELKAAEAWNRRADQTDEQQVNYGKWLKTKDDNKKRCSYCNVIHLIAQYPRGEANFCPNCGAKMEGVQCDN